MEHQEISRTRRRKLSVTTIITLLFYAYVFIALMHNSFSYIDPDLGWHLKIGEEIITEKSVPHINTKNFTLEGMRWVDHEWLANATMYLIYSNWGYVALTIVFVLLILAVLIIQNIFTTREFIKGKNGTLFIIFFQMLGILAAAGHWGVRVQELSLLFLLFLLILIHRFETNNNWKTLLFLPPLFFLWSCLHASFLIGFFVIFLWFAMSVLVWLLRKRTALYSTFNKYLIFAPRLEKKRYIWLGTASFISFLSTFFTPYGIELYSFLWSYKNTYYLDHVEEWLSVFVPPIQYFQLAYVSLIVVVVLFLILYNTLKRKADATIKLNFWYLALSSLLFILAIRSRRNFPLFFIVSFPLIVPFFAQLFNLPDRMLNEDRSKMFAAIKYVGLTLVITISTLKIHETHFTNNPFHSYCEDYPCAAVDFLKSDQDYRGLTFLNNYTWGGYLIWALPDQKLFIDGRLPICEFQGRSILEEYSDFFKKETVRDTMDEHRIELVLVRLKEREYKLDWFERHFLPIKKEESPAASQSVLKEYLDNSGFFTSVYADDTAAVYVRNTSVSNGSR